MRHEPRVCWQVPCIVSRRVGVSLVYVYTAIADAGNDRLPSTPYWKVMFQTETGSFQRGGPFSIAMELLSPCRRSFRNSPIYRFVPMTSYLTELREDYQRNYLLFVTKRSFYGAIIFALYFYYLYCVETWKFSTVNLQNFQVRNYIIIYFKHSKNDHNL